LRNRNNRFFSFKQLQKPEHINFVKITIVT
jgi:hypothetical protein